MSAIAQRQWTQYVRASVTGRPTENTTRDRPLQHLTLVSSSDAARTPQLASEHFQLDHIAELSANWDGNGSAPPNPAAIERARQVLEDAFRSVPVWQTPLAGASEDGDVIFEWWYGSKKLTMYISAEQIAFLKSWGSNVVTDMQDGVVNNPTSFARLWVWLTQ